MYIFYSTLGGWGLCGHFYYPIQKHVPVSLKANLCILYFSFQQIFELLEVMEGVTCL